MVVYSVVCVGLLVDWIYFRVVDFIYIVFIIIGKFYYYLLREYEEYVRE